MPRKDWPEQIVKLEIKRTTYFEIVIFTVDNGVDRQPSGNNQQDNGNESSIPPQLTDYARYSAEYGEE